MPVAYAATGTKPGWPSKASVVVIVCSSFASALCACGRSSTTGPPGPARQEARTADDAGVVRSDPDEDVDAGLTTFYERMDLSSTSGSITDSQVLYLGRCLRQRERVHEVLCFLSLYGADVRPVIPDLTEFLSDRKYFLEGWSEERLDDFHRALQALESVELPERDLQRLCAQVAWYPEQARALVIPFLVLRSEEGQTMVLALLRGGDPEIVRDCEAALSVEVDSGRIDRAWLVKQLTERLRMPESSRTSGARTDVRVSQILSTLRTRSGWRQDRPLVFCVSNVIRLSIEASPDGAAGLMAEQAGDTPNLLAILDAVRSMRFSRKAMLPAIGDLFLSTEDERIKTESSAVLALMANEHRELREAIRAIAGKHPDKAAREDLLGRLG
jgi:hypothetical protein